VSLGSSEGRVTAFFAREASTLQEAVRAAKGQLEAAGVVVGRVELDSSLR
jgi:hypothetical protein